VVLSSSADPGDRQRTHKLGADLHLTKPHDSREYLRLARDLIDAPRTTDADEKASGFS
jgi:CheY-like chemotaxis protein